MKSLGKGIVLLSTLILGMSLLFIGQLEAARPSGLGPNSFVIQTYTYKNGFLLSVSDANDNVTTYEYGLRKEQRNKDNQLLLTFKYDGSGSLSSITDQDDKVTRYEGGRTKDAGYYVVDGEQVAPGTPGADFIATAEYVYDWFDVNGNGEIDDGERGVEYDNGILDYVSNYRTNDQAGTRYLYSITSYENGKGDEEVLQVDDEELGLVAGEVLREWHYQGGSLKWVKAKTRDDGVVEWQTTYFEAGKESRVANHKGTTIVEYEYDGAKLIWTFNVNNQETTVFNAKGQREDVRVGKGVGGALVSEYVYDEDDPAQGGDANGATLDRRDDYDEDGSTVCRREIYEHNQPVELRLSDGTLLQSYTYRNGFLVSVTDHTDDTATYYKYGLRTEKSFLDGSGTFLTFKYDGSGNLASITNYQNEIETRYASGRTTSVGHYYETASGEEHRLFRDATGWFYYQHNKKTGKRTRVPVLNTAVGFLNTAEYVYDWKDLDGDGKIDDGERAAEYDDGILDLVMNYRSDDGKFYSITYLRADGQQDYEELQIDDPEGLGLVKGTRKTEWIYAANGLLRGRKEAVKAEGSDKWQTTWFEGGSIPQGGRETHVTNNAGTTIKTYHYDGAKLSYTYDTQNVETTWYNDKAQQRFEVNGEVDPDSVVVPAGKESWDDMSMDELLAAGVYVLVEYVYNATTDEDGDDNGVTLDYRRWNAWADAAKLVGAAKPVPGAEAKAYCTYQTEYYEHNQPVITVRHDLIDGVWTGFEVTDAWLNHLGTDPGTLGYELRQMGIKAGDAIDFVVDGGSITEIVEHIEVSLEEPGSGLVDLAAALEMELDALVTLLEDAGVQTGDTIDVVIGIVDTTPTLTQIEHDRTPIWP